MNPKGNTRIKKIRQILKASYPDVKTQLHHNNAFQLLMATILSAQCTDRQVNSVTPKLFAKLQSPEDFAKAPIKQIETLIQTPVALLSTSPEREDTILMKDPFED